ncbi:MAG: PEP-CTERM sorting domain-containing protein [Phycisphaerae bacterium]|nr:PEP-CTERM sorting domain-containing protein [Phycisphaerae bacterium]
MTRSWIVLAAAVVLAVLSAAPARADLVLGGNADLSLTGHSLGGVLPNVGGVGTTGNPYVYAVTGGLNLGVYNVWTNTNNNISFTLDLGDNDLTGTGATGLSTHRNPGTSAIGQPSGWIKIINPGTISIGAIDTANDGKKAEQPQYNNGGNVTIGVDTLADRAGDVRISSIDTRNTQTTVSGINGNYGTAGKVEIYSNGNVFIRNTAGTAGSILATTNGTTGTGTRAVYVKHDGSFEGANVDTRTGAISFLQSGNIEFNGDAKADGANGSFTATDLLTSGERTADTAARGKITIAGYVDVLVKGNVYTYVRDNTQLSGDVSMTAANDIKINGAIDLGTNTTVANRGILSLTATNGSVTLGSLNLGQVEYAKLAPYKWTYIQTLTGTPGTVLRTDSGKKVFKAGGGTTFTQLKSVANPANDGGWLVPGFGNMTADKSNSAATFGPAISAGVNSTVDYRGLQSVVTATTGTGGAATLSTIATIIEGGASGDATVTEAWRTRTLAENDPTTGFLVSDVLKLTGILSGDLYVLQMTYSEAAVTALGKTEADLGLLYSADDGASWLSAGTGVNMGAYDTAYIDYGNVWGVDTNKNVAWAVLDHNSQFAVGLVVPEPATMAFLAIGGIAILGGAIRRRRTV